MGAAKQEVNEVDKSVVIPTDKAAICAMAIVTERGPIGKALECVDYTDFVRKYGKPLTAYPGGMCAKAALDGGCRLLVSRVVHMTDVSDVSTRTSAPASVTLKDRASVASVGEVVGTATFPLRGTPGGTLILAVNAQANQTATFNATPATLTGSGASYTAVTASHTLVVAVNGVNRTCTFAGTENSQALFLAALNLQIPGIVAYNSSGQTKLQTDKMGSGASIAVVSGDADVLASLGLSVASGTNAGPNNVADIDAITAAEFTSIVQAAVTSPAVTAGADGSNHPYLRTVLTGAGASVQVQAASTLDALFGLDNSVHSGSGAGGTNTLKIDLYDGTYGNGLVVNIGDDSGDPTNRFLLSIATSAGVVLESFPGLSMSSSDPAYVLKVIRERSEIVQTITDLASGTAAPNNRPAVGSFAFTNGADGLSGLVVADYIGDANTGTGVHAFDVFVDFAMFATPDTTDPTVVAQASAWALDHKAKPAHIVHIPQNSTHTDAVAYRRGTSPYSHTALDTSITSFFYNWVEVEHASSKLPVMVPPTGEVFAAFARSVQAGGVFLSLAGPKRGRLSAAVRSLKFSVSPTQLDYLADNGINPIYKHPKYGFVIWGQKTAQKADSALQRLNVRLLGSFFIVQILGAIEDEQHELNDEDLWRELRNRVTVFAETMQAKRAITYFSVVCDSSSNTLASIAARETRIDFYFIATNTSEKQVLTLIYSPAGTTFSLSAA